METNVSVMWWTGRFRLLKGIGFLLPDLYSRLCCVKERFVVTLKGS